MKKKMVILVALLFSIILLTNVSALSKNNMTTLNLKRIKSLTTPSGGYSVVQGGGVTDKYIISVLENSKKGKNAIIVLNKEDYSYANIKGDNPILNRKYNKGNDLAFNSKTNEILILGDNKVFVLEGDNFKEKKKISLDKNYLAIAYNSKDDNYVVASKTKEGSKISIIDNEFKEISSFNIKHNYIEESLTIKDDNIYFTCYDKNTKENIIFIYDKTGNKQNIFLIPKSYNGVKYGELKNISFDGNKMILQFSKDNKINYYNQVSSNKITNDSINIKLNDKYEDNKYVLEVYENDNKIDTLRNKQNIFTFKPNYKKAGTYKYILKQALTNQENVIYDEEPKELIVNVKYNPVTNKYETTYNEVTFNNTELEETNKKNNTNDDNREVIIDNNGNKEAADKSKEKEQTKEKEKSKEKKKTKEKEQTKEKVDESKEELPGTSVDDIPAQIVEIPDTASSATLSIVIGISILLIDFIIIRKIKIID